MRAREREREKWICILMNVKSSQSRRPPANRRRRGKWTRACGMDIVDAWQPSCPPPPPSFSSRGIRGEREREREKDILRGSGAV